MLNSPYCPYLSLFSIPRCRKVNLRYGYCLLPFRFVTHSSTNIYTYTYMDMVQTLPYVVFVISCTYPLCDVFWYCYRWAFMLMILCQQLVWPDGFVISSWWVCLLLWRFLDWWLRELMFLNSFAILIMMSSMCICGLPVSIADERRTKETRNSKHNPETNNNIWVVYFHTNQVWRGK